jgi:methylmalonyl-CoA/ethylmalonyl-CoA epimerase
MDGSKPGFSDNPRGLLTAVNVTSIDHVAVAVRDLEQAIGWYSSVLGFQVLERRTTRGAATTMVSAVMSAGSAIIVLVQGGEPQSQVQKFIEKFGPGVQHVAFGVSDLDMAISSVEQFGGLAETGILEGVGIRQTFLRREPGSGVRVELIERAGGDFSDESVERLFRRMEQDGIF